MLALVTMCSKKIIIVYKKSLAAMQGIFLWGCATLPVLIYNCISYAVPPRPSYKSAAALILLAALLCTIGGFAGFRLPVPHFNRDSALYNYKSLRSNILDVSLNKKSQAKIIFNNDSPDLYDLLLYFYTVNLMPCASGKFVLQLIVFVCLRI